MNMQSSAAHGRRWWLSALLLAASGLGSPAFAATCNFGGYNVNPSNQNNVAEFGSAPSYARTVITLGINKNASQIAAGAADGVVLSWSQTGGPGVTLNTTNVAAPTFLAPDVTTGGATLTFRLTATCPPGPGAGSRSDTGTVSIINVNRPPVAYASAAPAIAYEGDTITLNSSAAAGTPVSNDPDGTALTYLWTKTSGPAITLANPTGPSASFVAPVGTPAGYTAQFNLRVSDGSLTHNAAVVVNVTRNVPPFATLSCPLWTNEGDPVVLNGSASYDPNGQSLTYAWRQLTGLTSILVGSETGNTVAFIAPVLTGGQDGFLEFELKATDTRGLFSLATCMTEIRDHTPPVITVPTLAPVDADSALGSNVLYAGVSAFDNVDGDLSALVTCNPVSGSLFAIGPTPVACGVDDSIGNHASASFNVTVADLSPPAYVDPPTEIAEEATAATGADVDFVIGTFDKVDGNGVAICAPLSNSRFALGDTTVTCNATDTAGRAAPSLQFLVRVMDTTAPNLFVPANRTFEASGTATALGTSDYGLATATDAVGMRPITNDAPALFPLGDTVITWTGTDTSGNSTTATTTITIADRVAPAISAPPDQTFEATAPLTLLSTFDYGTATATDAVGVMPIASDAPALFPVGATVITWTAIDASGNTATATTTITLADSTAPVVTPPANVTSEATAPLSPVAFGDATATDAVGVVSITNNAPATFPVGTTLILWTAKDLAGNSGTATSTVTVVDTTAPVVTPPASVTSEATAPLSPVAFGLATATDAVGVVSLTNNAPATFPVGATVVTWTATDLAGNSSAATSMVTVVDTTAPVVTPPANVTSEASAPLSVVAYGLATATDAVGVVSLASDAPEAFPVGATVVTWTATDLAGNSGTATSIVTVVDTTAPVVTAPASVTSEATAELSVVSYGNASATDAVGVVSLTNNAPATFPVGATVITWTAKDLAGNSGFATSTVTVVDTTAPVVTAPANVMTQATAALTAVAYGDATATDAVGVVSISNDAPSTFPVGATVITWTAKDLAGNSGFATSTVTVVDTIAPVVTPPANVTTEATAPLSVVAYGNATATDAVGVVALTSNAPATFPVGTTVITWTATDLAGNSGTATSTVTVADTTAPVVTPPANVTSQATGALSAVAYGNATATDAIGVVSITNDAPATFPIGPTVITWTATDLAGNSGTATSTVTVVDTTAPTINPHATEVREATSPGGAMVDYGAVGTFDMVDRTLVASCVSASGSTFALGLHTVKCNARDTAGNHAAETSFTVTVRDTVAPVIAAHADVGPVEATGPAGAVVNYGSIGTYDVVDTGLVATCVRASGGTFAIGPHSVTCNAIDASGNPAASTSFAVSVRDTIRPVITQVADISVPATGNSQASLLFPQITAADAVGVASLACRDNSGRSLLGGQNYAFSAGNTLVTCTALDGAGNSGEMRFTVAVTYTWNGGFLQPIDNDLINTAKAGSAIPVKFTLGGNQGLGIFATHSPASGSASCSATPTDEIEVLATTTAGGSTLSYDAGSGQYIYVWKTEKTWLGCRQLRVTLKDGSVRTAIFKFR